MIKRYSQVNSAISNLQRIRFLRFVAAKKSPMLHDQGPDDRAVSKLLATTMVIMCRTMVLHG